MSTIKQQTIDDKPFSLALQTQIKLYLEWETNEEYRQQIEDLVRQRDFQTLNNILMTRLTFGTAGIRGKMDAGFARMNDLVIIQTAQGLVSYLLELDAKSVKEKGVIIGNDARYNSSQFARLTALAFLQKSIPVYLCDHIVPTPLIAFGVLHYSCFAGIMITASHNPKDDNGFKVFFDNGAQILSPHDKNIQSHIEKPENLKPWPKAWQQELLLLPPSNPEHPIQARASSPKPPSVRLTSPSSATLVSASSPAKPIPPSPLCKEWSELVYRIHGDLTRSYFNYIESAIVGDRQQLNSQAGISVTYTVLHGVGHMYLSRALDIAGFEETYPVESQKKPDPEFSTVRYPNPEEKGALDQAFETASHANSTLILANDPDSDRLGAALYYPESGNRRILTGNEIGALLSWWIWVCHQKEQQEIGLKPGSTKTTASQAYDAKLSSPDNDKQESTTSSNINQENDSNENIERQIVKIDPSDCYMIASAVSSSFISSLADVEGFNFVQTLTGFKNMCNFADRLHKQSNGSKKVLFAFEEALGYMVDTTVMDKDGISAAIQLAQCAAHCKSAFNRNLEQQLDFLYDKYGYHYSINSYYICNDSEKINHIFKKIQLKYPTKFSFYDKTGRVAHEFKVSRVRDLNNGYDSGEQDKLAKLPMSSSSFMLTFFIDKNISITFRTSGTEPKIKYYSEIKSASDNESRKRAQVLLSNLVSAAVSTCLQPDQHHLVPEVA